MTNKTSDQTTHYGAVKNTSELGSIIRKHRKKQSLTLEKVSGLTHIGTRFISELERGKETAELGKAIETIRKLGLEIIIQPRGYGKYPHTNTKSSIDHGKS